MYRVQDTPVRPINLSDAMQSMQHVIEFLDSPAPHIVQPEYCSIARGEVEAILPTTGVRSFDYPVRTWSTQEKPLVDLSTEYDDPYHDFPTTDWVPPKIAHTVSGFYLKEILTAIHTPRWLIADYIAFYTMWSQQAQGQYDEASDLFCAYFPLSEQNRFYCYCLLYTSPSPRD